MSSTKWPTRWSGQWIWSDRPALGGPTTAQPYGSHDPSRFDQRVLFRRVIELDAAPARARLRLTADSGYRLFVNGEEIGSGPVRHGPRGIAFDDYDLGGALGAGRTAIAVIARFLGHPVPWWEPSPPSLGLGGGSFAAELDLDGRIIGTDEDWRFLPADAWTPQQPAALLMTQPEEMLDARLLDPSWTRADFDDSAWRPARIIREHSIVGPVGLTVPGGEPWGAPVPRPVPALTGDAVVARVIGLRALGGPISSDLPAARRQLAEALEEGCDPIPAAERVDLPAGAHLVVADLGRIASGRLELGLTAAEGTVVIASAVEVPRPAALDSSPLLGYIARGDDDAFRSSERVGGRYVALLVDGAEPGRIEGVAIREALRPRIPVPPFRSDDPRLDRIYDVAVRTLDLCAHDAYIDCPTREQRAWVGDAVVHQSVDLIVNQDWSLARWSPQLLAQPRADGLLPMVVAGDFATPQVPSIPDWSLHWIRSVHQLYRATGDRELVARLLGVAEGVLRWFERTMRDGLAADVPGWVLIDWSPVQVAGTSAALNALLARAFADVAEMAGWLGDTGRAEWARSRHREIGTAFERFWDEERGAYRDTFAPGSSVSEHTAAAAVTAGIVPEGRRDAVLRLLRDRDAMFTTSPLADHGSDALGPAAGRPVSLREAPDWDTDALVVGAQPFFRAIVHEALAVLGDADRVSELCLDWERLLASGPTAFREVWEGGSFCHGWSTTPARDLIAYTLGIQAAEPGFSRVRVAPRLGALTRASGAAATPHGPVRVEVDGTDVVIESPVPVEVVDRAGRTQAHPAGLIRTTI